MIIGVDVDNVLNNLSEALLEIYNQDTGDSLTIYDIKGYYIENFVKPEYKDKFKEYFVDKRVWKSIKCTDGSQEYLEKIIDNGHRVVIVTATESVNFHKKFKWLSRNYPFIDYRKNLISVKDKQLLKLDVLIDDYAKNLGSIVDDFGNEITADYIKICLDYPWNKSFVEDNKTKFRCKNWEEIYKVITGGRSDNGSSNKGLY